MIAFIVILFVFAGAALILARNPLAKAQGLLFGGTIFPGCIVAEAVIFFLLALAAWLLRHHIE